jgi:hypothetical protein
MMDVVQWEGLQMDLSHAAVQDIAATHFGLRPQTVLTFRVGEKAWGYARREIAQWNQASVVAPQATFFNLYLENFEGHDWSVESDFLRVKVRAC